MEDEVVEVEVIRQADDWGQASNVSATTGSRADGGDSASALGRGPFFIHGGDDDDLGHATRAPLCGCHYFWSLTIGCLALLTPIVFVCAPLSPSWEVATETKSECNNECGTLIVSFGVRLLVLFVGVCVLLLRKPRATGPSIHRMRSLALLLCVVVLVAYWLFFGLVLAGEKEPDYNVILRFANSLLDAELFLHYVAVIMIEIGRLRARYNVKVTRNSDGWSRSYNVGRQSVQETAYDVVNAYYRDFPDAHASMLAFARQSSPRAYKNHVSGLKFYDIDVIGEADPTSVSISSRSRRPPSNSRRGGKSRRVNLDERVAEESENEKKIERRRARLIAAVDESFNLIKPTRATGGAMMGADEAAAAIFPSMARALQKYLRATRQQSRHSAESVVNHLSRCLRLDMSSRAFLQRYFAVPTTLEIERERDREADGDATPHSWRLLDQSGGRAISGGLEFRLQNVEVSLIVEISDLPELRIIKGKEYGRGFHLKVNSETTV